MLVRIKTAVDWVDTAGLAARCLFPFFIFFALFLYYFVYVREPFTHQTTPVINNTFPSLPHPTFSRPAPSLSGLSPFLCLGYIQYRTGKEGGFMNHSEGAWDFGNSNHP